MATALKEKPIAAASTLKLVVDRAVLLKSLGHVQSVVEKRGTIPILSHVKLEATADTLRLTATDMDIAVVEDVAAEVRDRGTATVPAHTFYEIVRKLPEGAQVEIATEKGNKVVLRSGTSRFALASLPVDEFPVMAEGELPYRFTLKSQECLSLLQKARFAISTEETRYYLNGIYLHAAVTKQSSVLRAVATDGHRLARIEVALPQGASEIPGVIIPRKTIHELMKLLEEGGGEVNISLSDTKIRFACGSAVLVSKLIDGTFPDYERVIPAANDKIMEVDGRAFLHAVDRVSVIASEKTRGVKLSLDKGKLTLAASSTEQGTAVEEVDVNYGASPIEIGFNSRYLLEMMSQIEGETVQFVFADSASPAVVRDTADVGSLYVIMPMRV